MKAAFFDIDGTIIRENSMERMFLKYLVERGKFNLWDMFNFGVLLLGDLFTFSLAKMRGDKRYLRGKGYEEMKGLAEECFKNVIRANISPWAIECIENHRKDGYKIILLTGSVDILAEPLSRYLGADFAISTKVKMENGRFTGDRMTPHPYGETKRKLLLEFCQEQGIKLSESWGYADRYADVPFLSLVGWPVAVNPDQKLRKYTLQNNWKVIQF